MTRGILLLTLLVMGGCPSVEPAPTHGAATETAPLVLTGVTLVDVSDGSTTPGVTLVVEEGRVVSITETAPDDLPPDALVLDGTGKWVIPGLIDVHVHDASEAYLADLLSWGVTAIHLMPNTPPDSPGPVERASESSVTRTPRLQLTEMFAGAFPDNLVPGVYRFHKPGTVDEARRLVRESHARGYRQVKLILDDSAEWSGEESRVPLMSQPVYEALAQEAHALDMRVYVHATQREVARSALTSGLDAFLHGVMDGELDADDWREMAEDHVVWVPTTHAVLCFGDQRQDALRVSADARFTTRLSEAERTQWAELASAADPIVPPGLQQLATNSDAYLTTLADNTRAALDAGVTVAVGTDGGPAGISTHLELELLQEGGLTPTEVLRAATLGGAIALGREAELGSVEIGKLADLVVLNTDPTVDVRNCRDIELVIKGGAVHRPTDAHPPRPNVVVILCDDLGWGDLSCQGHPIIRTERLDRLAAQGVRFTSFYSAAPVCSPSRVGLLTGRSPGRAGIYDWIPPAKADAPPRDDRRELVHLRRGETTLANLLRDDGYATCMVGKWHCNSRFGDPVQPQPGDHGFDHWLGTGNNAQPSHLDPANFIRNGQAVGALQGSACQLVVDEALTWLQRQRAESPEQPFFLYVAFHEPHEPVAAPEELVELYLPQSNSRKQAEYFACVHNMDLATGRLLDALDELGLGQDTLVVFSSDNGPETLNRYGGADRSYGTPGPLRGMKLWTTEAGIRVPGIVRWPGTLPAGAVSDTVVSSLDLLPTICALAGVALPQDRPLDGIDARAALHGGPLERSQPLLWIYYNALNERRVAMRDGEWKLLARLVDADGEALGKDTNVHTDNADRLRAATLTDLVLFRLTDDLAEERDLAGQHPEELERLRARMESAYAELVGDSLVWRR